MTMQMTPRKIMGAYKAIHELIPIVLPYKAARQITKLKKRLVEEFETVVAQEEALVQEYGGQREGNRYKFSDEQVAQDFQVAHTAFLNQEDSIDLPHVDLSSYQDMIRVSIGAIEALEGIVTFEED